MAAPLVNNAACTPNYSSAGRRARKLIAFSAIAITVVTFAVMLIVNAPWYLRLLLFIPGSMAAGTWLQVSRSTCVARARERVVENEDFSRTPASDDAADASIEVAVTIVRDALIAGLLLAALGALTALI
jgi:hypothetical protein